MSVRESEWSEGRESHRGEPPEKDWKETFFGESRVVAGRVRSGLDEIKGRIENGNGLSMNKSQ